MKSRDGKSQREEKSRRGKKMQMREKVGKSRNTVFFPMICGSGGSKSRLAKAAGAEPAGQMRDEKLHAVVVRSTFRSQHVKSTTCSRHFWKLRCRKSARRCGAKHISKSKCTKHHMFTPLLEVEMSKKGTPLWREAHFEVKMYKTPHVRATFRGSDVVLRGRRKGLCTLSKVSKTWRFCSISKNDGRRGTFEEDLQRCIFRGRRNTRDILIGAVRRRGGDFLRGVAFWSIRSCGLLRWFCVTGAALRMTWHHFFVEGAVLSTGGLEKSQNALVRGRQLCTQLSIFEGSLAELLCFWCC